jgi:hypothetical protein
VSLDVTVPCELGRDRVYLRMSARMLALECVCVLVFERVIV